MKSSKQQQPENIMQMSSQKNAQSKCAKIQMCKKPYFDIIFFISRDRCGFYETVFPALLFDSSWSIRRIIKFKYCIFSLYFKIEFLA